MSVVCLVCICALRPLPNHNLFLSHLPFLAPLENPEVRVNFTSNSITLNWQDYASDFQSAFVEGYRVYLKSKELQCHPQGKRTWLPGDACSSSPRLSTPFRKQWNPGRVLPRAGEEHRKGPLCDRARLGTRLMLFPCHFRINRQTKRSVSIGIGILIHFKNNAGLAISLLRSPST